MVNKFIGGELDPRRMSLTQELSREDTGSNTEDSGRGKWKGKLDFIFGCISYAVGLGNVWRFPYLVHDNGGGAFLIPYFICLFFTAIPMFYLEVAMGQYLSAAGIGIWKVVPIFKGIGIASLIIVLLSNIYYMILVAWIVLYLVNSFHTTLPWGSCDNHWNTINCSLSNATHASVNGSVSPVVEFWERHILNISSGIHELGFIQWKNFASLTACWVFVYLIICRGLHNSGKIVWVTAIFPYICLISLLIRGLTLDGFSDGLTYFITPQWEALTKPKVWIAAGTQVFYTFGIGMGSVVTLGSYNHFHQNFFRDCATICIINPMTSLLAGTVIFSVLGHMAHEAGKPVADVVASGPGLAFQVYPQAVLQMPGSSLWSIMFFLMLLCLGINSQFCPSEAIVAGITDEYPQLIHKRKYLTLGIIVIQYICGIPMVFQGGMYILHIFDNYAATGITLLFVVFFQCIALSWIYGVDRIGDNCMRMIGRRPYRYFIICWVVAVPLMCVAIFTFTIVAKSPLEYGSGYKYPWWGEAFGWFLAMLSMSAIPGYALYFLVNGNGSLLERLHVGLKPQASASKASSSSDFSNRSNKYVFPVIKEQDSV